MGHPDLDAFSNQPWSCAIRDVFSGNCAEFLCSIHYRCLSAAPVCDLLSVGMVKRTPVLAYLGSTEYRATVQQNVSDFQDFSERAFFRSDLERSSLKDLTAQADSSIRATNKALKIVAMTGSLPPSERNAREAWMRAIAVQARLLAHLLAISRLLQDNRENPLLHELTTELSALGESLSATFAGLSVAIVNQHLERQLPNPELEFQRWQNKLNNMRAAGTTQSYNLSSRLAVGLIEHRLAGLNSDLSKILSWLETSRSDVPNDLPLALEPTR